MLSEPALVTALEDGRLFLQADRARACGKCSLKRGCGQYLLGAARTTTLSLDATTSTVLQPGTEVRLALPVRSLLQLVACFYLPPLFLLLSAAMFGWGLGLSELLQLFCALLGLASGLMCSRMLLRGHQPPLLILPAVAPIAAAPVSSGVILS